METARKYVSILLLLVLSVTFSFSAFAAPVATPSQIQIVPEDFNAVKATSSDMLMSISPFAVDGADAPIYADIHDDSTGAYIGNQKGTFNRVAGGHYVYRWPQLPEGQHYAAVYILVTGGEIPSPGKYGVSFSMFQENLTIGPSVHGYVTLRSWGDNVSQSLNSVKADLVSANGGWTGQATVTLGYANSSVTCMLQWPEHSRDLEVGIPEEPVIFTYKINQDVPEVVAPDVDAGISGDDALININQGISNSVSSIDGSIKQLIQTIINQLDALWNQFAGEFTNMFAAWQTHTNAIVSAIQNITTTASDGIENIIQAGHNDADQISGDIQNAEENITNGYDNSGMTSDNDRLDSSLQEYDSAEDALISDAEDAINGVDFTIDLTSFSGVIATISGFLQDCYENSGQFQIVINLALLCSLASCVIGLYRFKGGG